MKDHHLYLAIVELSDCDDRKEVDDARKAIVKYLSKIKTPYTEYIKMRVYHKKYSQKLKTCKVLARQQ